jgi:hypothetical protein
MALETRRRRVCRDPMTYSGMYATANTWKLAGTGLEVSCAAAAILRYRPPMPVHVALTQERRANHNFSP